MRRMHMTQLKRTRRWLGIFASYIPIQCIRRMGEYVRENAEFHWKIIFGFDLYASLLRIATGVVNVFYQCALRGVCGWTRESSLYGDKDKAERNKQIKTHTLYCDKPVAIHKI